MRIPDGADGGGSGSSVDGFTLAGASEGWRGWAGDFGGVLRRGWRVTAGVLLVTMVIPLWPLSGLIADGATIGAAASANGKSSGIMLALGVIGAPVLLVLGTGGALIVTRGWASAVWAAKSACSGRSASLRDALRRVGNRNRRLWGGYMIGVAVLVGAALLSGSAAPQSSIVPALLMLAGPAGLLAPVLCFAFPTAGRRRADLAPMALVLALIVGCEVTVALVLSWLMNPASAGSPDISGPVAALIASLIALPGSVLLAAASSVTYARFEAEAEAGA
jgi:hypothetical protein